MPSFYTIKTIYYTMRHKISTLVKEIDNIIKVMIPTAGNFHEEVKLLLKKEALHKKIDVLVEKYDKLINELEEKGK